MTSNNWKSLVPEKYVHLTKCYHVMKQYRYHSRDISAEIVICTVQGYVLEFSGLRIVGCCKISTTNPKHITYFSSFDYNSNPFYIIESNDAVIILKKNKELQVTKQYENVKRSIISDFSNTGYPQLGIWTGEEVCSETPDIIVNLHDGDRSMSEDCNISTILNEKYEELKMKVKDHEEKLKLKKQHRMYNCEYIDHAKTLSSTSGYQLIQLVGQDHREIDLKEGLHQELALQVAETWQRMHNNKWVIGITICNTGQRDLQNVHLILKSQDEEKLSWISKLVMYCKDETPSPCKRRKMEEDVTEGVAAWKQVHGLKSRRKAVLIGVLDIPKFLKTSTVKISALIMYKFDKESNIGYQVPVSSFNYHVGDYCKRIGSPFSMQISEADLLSVLMSSITITVPVIYKANFEPSLWRIFVDELKFVEYSQLGCLYHKGTCHVELAGVMLHVDKLDPLKYQVSITAKNMQQIYLLVHCMYNVLSAPLMLILPPQIQRKKQTEGIAYRLVDEELELVVNQLKRWVVEKETKFSSLKSDVQVPYAEYLKFRARLSELELKTDISFVSQE